MGRGISIAVEMRDWPQREVVKYSLELLEVYWHKGIRQQQRRVLGVYIHGRAADNFVKRHPKPLLTAALLPDLLAPVIHELEQDNVS